jgi:hypothetical protein
VTSAIREAVVELIKTFSVALTPAGSIAKPTLLSADVDVTTKAVPASSPKPTVAPITSPSQTQVSSKTISPKQSPESAETPSPSQASNSAKQPESLTVEQSQENGRLDSGRPSPTLDSGHPVTPAKGDTILPSQATKPVEPHAGSSEGSADDDFPAGKKNALSVLSEAQSSAKAANSGFHADPAGPATPSHYPPLLNDPAPAMATPGLFTIALSDGCSATVRVVEDTIVVAQNDLSAGVAPGSEVTIGTHVFSAAPQGTAIIVDNIATHAVPSPAIPSFADSPPALVFTADGRILSAINLDDKVLILDGTQTFTAEAGEALEIGSRTIIINLGASGLIVGATTLAIPTKAQETTGFATAVWTADGSIFTAFKQDGSIVVHDSDLTTTLAPGVTATIAGEILSVAVSGSFLVRGGNTATFVDHVAIRTLLPNGQTLVAVAAANGDSIVIQ